MEKIIIILVIVFLIYEFIEHLAFPLIWSLLHRKKKSLSGPERILGEVGEVKKWDGEEGYIIVGGELWKALSDKPLRPGNKVIVKKVENITLVVDLLGMRR